MSATPPRTKPSDPTVNLRRGRGGVDVLAQTHVTPTSSENAALQILALRPEVEQGLINDQAKQAVKARLFGDADAPSVIGRFKVIRELGRGGTGIVYIAYDVELDRKIAVKLLNNERPDEQTGSANARLLREAQAMARVSHPNIAAVHEVGMFRGQIYVAMEFVLGQTLSAWLHAGRRDDAGNRKPGHRWQDILAVFRQAAAGLAAAHDAGLVHRDFKPANAILGEDHRLRVLDFGLARADATPGGIASLDRTDEGHVDLPAADAADASKEDVKLDLSLTVTGTVLGTPAYMSPEQFLGQRIDAKSDQFSFCVALYEALFGERPFDGDTLSSLMAAVLAGKVREPPAAARVPRWLRAAVLRGLRNDPEQRWPSMHALSKALTPERSTRAPIVAALGFGVAMTIGATSYLGTADAAAQVCSGADEQLTGVWDEARKEQVKQAMLSSGAPGAATTFERAAERLDAYAADWVAAHTDACEATNVRLEQSNQLMDQRMTCLAERRHALAATVNVLAVADKQTAENAVDAVVDLPAVARCNELEYVSTQVKPPDDPNAASRVDGARTLLREADARENVGKFTAALDLVEQAAASVKDLDYPPLRAEIALRRGVSLELLSQYQKARPALEEAYFTALAVNHVPVAIDAAVALVLVTGRRLSTPDVMQMWVRHAEALLQRGGDDRQIARLAANRGLGSFLVADYGNGEARQLKAREFYTEALKTYEQHNDLLNIGRLQIAIGETYEYVSPPDYAAAEQHFRKAVDSFVLGACEEHPGVALAHTSVGYILRMQHRLAEAEAELKKAGELTAAALGTDHRNYGLILSGLAAVHMEREELDKAEPLLRRALEIHADREGYEHINTQSAQQTLGHVLVELGKYDDAIAVAERLMTGIETNKNFNPYMLANASLLLWDAYAGARRAHEVTSRIQATYDRVAALQEPAELEPSLLFALAKAHEEAGAADARALALQARSNAEAMGYDAGKMAMYDDWLAQHPARK